MPAWPVRHDGTPPAVAASPLLAEHSGRGAQELARPRRAQDRGAGAGEGDVAALTVGWVERSDDPTSQTANLDVGSALRLIQPTNEGDDHGGADRLGNPGEGPEEGGHGQPVLHHGRADAARRSLLHQGRHPADRRAPRAGGRADGPGLQPAAAEAQRVHGGERARRDQPDDRHGQCADRLLPGGGDRRLEPDLPVRPAGVPGDRPGRDHARLREVGRPRLQPEAHPRAGEQRLPERDERQARADLSRFPRRHPLRQDPRGAGRLVHERPADAECAAAGRPRAGRRADPGAVEGQEAGDHLGQRRDLVARLERDAAVRREGRHPVLHDAAGPRRGARRPPALLPHHALHGVQGCRPHHRARHAHELHHRPRRAAALQRSRQDRPHRHRRRRDRYRRAQGRHRHRRRLQKRAATSCSPP